MARGRVSASASNVVSIVSEERIRPPIELPVDQAREWVEIVNRMPADWFPRETIGLLIQYCRHRVACDRVARLIAVAEAAPELDLREYDRLLAMQEREGRALSSLATRMRLTQQSQFDKTKKRGTSRAKPWENN